MEQFIKDYFIYIIIVGVLITFTPFYFLFKDREKSREQFEKRKEELKKETEAIIEKYNL